MKEGTLALLEIIKGAYKAAYNLHADNNQLEFEAWLKLPAADRKKKPFVPCADRAEACASFEDFVYAGMDAYARGKEGGHFE